METSLECWHADPDAAPANRCHYSVNDGELPRTTWDLRTDADHHSTLSDPQRYVADDFIIETDARYVASDETTWGLFVGPPGYEGSFPLPAAPIPSLCIARAALGSPVNKDRSIVFQQIEGDCEEPGRVALPFTWVPGPSGGWRGPFNMPRAGTLVHEGLVEDSGGMIQGASVFWWSVAVFFSDVSSISWRFENPPTFPNEYVLFQTGRAEVRTGLYAADGDVLRCEMDQTSETGPRTVRWYINEVLQHTFEDVSPWSLCECISGWTRGASSATLERIDVFMLR
jgi:hypothetical protein